MPRLINIEDRLRAINLRKQGKTYSEIRKIVDISNGTLSYWSHKIILSSKARARLKNTQSRHLIKARLAGAITLKNRQKEYLDDLKKRVTSTISKSVTLEMLRVALAFLHLGEGAKWKSHRGLQLGSSDPLILQLYIKLLIVCYNIDRNRFHYYICYRADQDLVKLKKYWSSVLKIPMRNFYDSRPDPRTIGKKTLKKDYKGVCIVSHAGSAIQQELEQIPEIIYKGL